MDGLSAATAPDRSAVDLLAAVTRALADSGVAGARLDAEILLAEAWGTDRAGLFARLRAPVPADTQRRFRALAARRAVGEPLQYITGRQEFWSRDFVVTRDVLIPRPETQRLVELALEVRAGRGAATSVGSRSPLRVCDVGTGSGCLALTVACEWPDAEVWALDVSAAALQAAAVNARRLGVAGRVRFVHGDLLDPVAGQDFDLIVSNPPYVPSEEIGLLQRELQWEPRRALDGGADGLAVIRRLLPAAYAHLEPGGVLLMEFGAGQASAVEELARAAGYATGAVRPDDAGLPRVLVARR
jgi:release factor glutamine methyltransferase